MMRKSRQVLVAVSMSAVAVAACSPIPPNPRAMPAKHQTAASSPGKSMDCRKVEGQIRKIIAEQLSVAKEVLVPSANILEDLGADSLDTVELVMALEEEFSIDIPDDVAERMCTVGEVVATVQSRIGCGR